MRDRRVGGLAGPVAHDCLHPALLGEVDRLEGVGGTIYDGGARRYEIHEHIEEVLEFWNGILERADSIDKQALLEEKLGHPLPISYEDWLKDCHYEKLDKKTTRWLYQQERGFVEGMRDVSLKEIARQRIDEFTTTLRKYIL